MIANVTFAEWVLGVGFVTSTTGLIVTFIRWRAEIAEKRLEKQKREIAEAQLLENRKRAEAPYLVASAMWADSWARNGIGEQRTKNPGEAFTLEDQPPHGAKITLAVRNQGQHVRNVTLRINNEIVLDALRNEITEAEANKGKRSPLFTYSFNASQLGQQMQFILSFESFDGFQQEHRYQTRHGVCELQRIDPA